MNNNENNVNVQTNNKKFPIVPIIIGIVVFFVVIAIAVVVFLVVANSEPKNKIYLTEGEVSLIYGSANNYKKKYVKLTGQVIDVKYDNKGQIITAYTDIANYTNDIIVYFEDKSVSIKQNDYISIDGYIKGADKETSKPYIIGKEVKTISYMDAVAPTKKSVEFDKTSSQNDVTITVQKVEFSDVETRVYVKVSNNSKDEFKFQTYSTILTQNAKQYETTYSKTAVDVSSSILAGGRSEGILVFPKIEQSNFTLTMKGFSTNYDVDFENFTFDLAIN